MESRSITTRGASSVSSSSPPRSRPSAAAMGVERILEEARAADLVEGDASSVQVADLLSLDHTDRSRPARSEHRAPGRFSPNEAPGVCASRKRHLFWQPAQRLCTHSLAFATLGTEEVACAQRVPSTPTAFEERDTDCEEGSPQAITLAIPSSQCCPISTVPDAS